jgi:23S rRNA (cytidine1920-2'-O)/16S rRNA (cytidine1409-2'-O)-methyltransferase
LDLLSIGAPVDLVVADLSFISVRTVLPTLRDLATSEASFIVLVKPQFEVEKGSVGMGGVVREPAAWARVLDGVVSTAADLGLGAVDAMASPVPGPAGNVEFLLSLRAAAGARADLARAVAEGTAVQP